jgi:YidC/Oxa1 family membrane protein insertase
MFNGLYEGMAWVLAFFFAITKSYGFSIVLLTVAVMVVVTPLTLKGTRSMMAMQQYQPEIRRLQQEHKGDRQKLNEELLKFYRENNINPMGSCLPLLIQAPIFFVLFHAIRGLTTAKDGVFVPKYIDAGTQLYKSLAGQTEMPFLGIDLSMSALGTLQDESFLKAIPYLLIVAIVAGSSYIQQRQVSGRNPGSMTPQQRQMMRIVPLFSITVAWFPAALGVYWVTSNLCRVATQWYISRTMYGIRRGQPRPEPSEPPAGAAPSAKSKPAKPSSEPKSTKGATPAARGRQGASGKANETGNRARQSGRVTEPKRRPNAAGRPPGRPVPGRRGTDAPRAGGSRAERPSRRAPNGPAATEPGTNGSTETEPGADLRKKRRR